MKIKTILQVVVEFLTNKKCKNCKYNKGIFNGCMSPKNQKCVSSIFPVGYEPKEKGGGSDA